MVDWDRVEELRSKGWDWDRIAKDPKVGFHPDTSVRDPGRALRGLYHRQRYRERRSGQEPSGAKGPKKPSDAKVEPKWSLARIGYLVVPIFGIWFALAYFIPSPVGLVLKAIPDLAIGLAAAVVLLIFGLWRIDQERWSKVFRNTLIIGIVLGLIISGLIAVVAVAFVGCPYLPSTSAGTPQPGGQGWVQYPASAWQDSGRPILYFYGATWCPYCSASSWAVWKALSEYGSVSGASFSYSSSTDVYASTPEVILANIGLSSSTLSFQVSEDTSGVEGNFPGTTNCVQQAYVTSYGGGSIPFAVVNGQYVHAQATIINPADLSTWAGGSSGGYTAVANSVSSESGQPWSVVQTQAWWIMAFIAKASGEPVSQLASQYHWSSATTSAVSSDVSQLT
jgi:hypothetical protein